MRLPGRQVLVMLIILAVAAGLRFWGLNWGLPNTRHYFSYHPDGTLVLMAALRVNFFEGQLDPGFYNYGTLYIYLVNAGVVLASVCGAINLGSGDISSSVGEFANMYTVGRIVAVLLGLATVYLVFILGRRMYGLTVGLLAAAFMAVIPLHVMHSKFLAVDVPATFFVVLCLIFAVRIPDAPQVRYYILSGLFAGLAAATKYSAGLVLLAPVAAHAVSVEGRLLRYILHPRMLAGVLAAGAGFLAGCPGVLLEYERFARDFGYERIHMRTGHGFVFADTGSGLAYHVSHSLLAGFGYPLLVLAGLGLVYAAWHAKIPDAARRLLLCRRVWSPLPPAAARDWMLVAFFVAYYAVIGTAQVKFARYTMPLLPVTAILAARILVESERCLKNRSQALSKVVIAIALSVLGYTALYAASLSNQFAGQDTRDHAAGWVSKNIAPGSSIGLATIPWFYTPPLDPYFGLPSAQERYERVLELTDYKLIVSEETEWDAGVLARVLPDFVILSEFEYEDRKRLGDPAAERYFGVLAQDYRVARRFVQRPSLLGLRFPLPRELPHDMSYASPDILIYARGED